VEFTWSTFVLEIINFLVLVWILKRFLYKPVLDVIAARRRSVEQQLAQARATADEATALKEQYTGRLKEIEAERRKAREDLARDIDQERARRLADLAETLEREKEKARVAEERRQTEHERALGQQALQQGASFSSKLLGQAAGPELEGRLLQMLVDELAGLTDEQRTPLREQWGEHSGIDVASAFDLTSAQRAQLTSALQALVDPAEVQFRRDPALIAGLRIEIGAWVLAINVRDELKGFAELASGGR
jgi:F-type H+-transporting ATPase subunit b